MRKEPIFWLLPVTSFQLKIASAFYVVEMQFEHHKLFDCYGNRVFWFLLAYVALVGLVSRLLIGNLAI